MKTAGIIALCLILGIAQAQIEISPFVINGGRVPLSPYYVLVEYFNAQALGFFGGGALITNRHILTAATNVQGFVRFDALVGSSTRASLRRLAVMTPGTPHPQFNLQTRANDIAILRLVTPIIPQADLHPIALPPQLTPPVNLPLENEEGFFVGFGYETINSGATDFLKRGYHRISSATVCSAFFLVNNENQFCGMDNVERANGCAGDVGNPFVVQYRREDILVGVLTMHPQCGSHSPAAFTRVTAYRVWINEQTAI